MTLAMTAVIFQHFDAESCRFVPVRVESADIAAYHAETHEWVSGVIFEDGFQSWGKSWVYTEARGDLRGKIAKIGAGAYGDVIVWRDHAFYA
jgi:hypothetical protein